MKVLITGSNGFIARNLQLHLLEREGVEILTFSHSDAPDRLTGLVAEADFIYHLAGVNRPQDVIEFETGNVGLTYALAEAVVASKKKIPILYTSSIQAELDNPYGQSKKKAEDILLDLNHKQEIPVFICRLANVFGKWAKPNYNSAVATFCHNIACDLPIQIHNPDADITLVYIDDVIRVFLSVLDDCDAFKEAMVDVHPQYTLTVGQLADSIQSFKNSRNSLIIDKVGTGLIRALYATYVSYLPTDRFTYKVPKYEDARGVFAEMLKTQDSGQFSFFTAHPGITRGGHYHHSKTEKFLVIKGRALFRFRHMMTDEYHELYTSGEEPEIVETVPGWTHDITNIGHEEMVVMLWANEIFDRNCPDTYACAIK